MGQVAGAAVGLAIGFGAGAGIVRAGVWGARLARGYAIAGDVVGVAQSSYNLATGQATGWDALGFLPTVGWGAGRLRRAAMAPRVSGLTLPGGTPNRIAASADEVNNLYHQMLRTAGCSKFVRRARALGFSDDDLAALSARITHHYEGGQIGFTRVGGWADSSNVLIGKGRWFRGSRIRHELGHVLHDISQPGVMTRSLNRQNFGWTGYFQAEMIAFGTQLGRWNPARPYLAGLTATHNRFGYLGTSIYLGASFYGSYQVGQAVFGN